MDNQPTAGLNRWSNGLFLSISTFLYLITAYQVAAVQPGSATSGAGNAEAGRIVFHGKGVCHYCHGIDGDRHNLPQIEQHTASLIARLDPRPTDLRDPGSLRLKTDKERAKVIRDGHDGTGMFPDTRMTDQELADTLAYLAVLRKEGHAAGR